MDNQSDVDLRHGWFLSYLACQNTQSELFKLRKYNLNHISYQILTFTYFYFVFGSLYCPYLFFGLNVKIITIQPITVLVNPAKGRSLCIEISQILSNHSYLS